MDDAAIKADLLDYLQRARESLVWKLDGLSEYDMRRPVVPSGTNLLGLVKHCASVESSYLGAIVGRPFPEPRPWEDDASDPDADLWATAEESPDWVIDLYRRVALHSESTVAALDLGAFGHVPWWPEERATVPLHRLLTHVLAETHRHAGHADLLRELIDGTIGFIPQNDNLPSEDPAYWPPRYERLEALAQRFRRSGSNLDLSQSIPREARHAG